MTCKEIYCDKCCKRQVHKKIGSSSSYAGLGIARGILAISSLGLSETITRDYYWQCLKCGEIQKRGI